MDYCGTYCFTQEDQTILTLINRYGTTQWTTIATEMKIVCGSTRSSKQIR